MSGHRHLPQQGRARNAIHDAEQLAGVRVPERLHEILVAHVQAACDQAATEACETCRRAATSSSDELGVCENCGRALWSGL